jgi:Putative zinc-finger
MNHPKREEWVPYLFGEATSEARAQLSAHLRSCAECRHEIEAWQGIVKRLDQWKLASAAQPARRFAPAINWAAAAALVMLLAFGAGRVTARPDVEKVRAAIEPRMRNELKQELTALIQSQNARNAADILAAANQQTEQTLASLTKAIDDSRTEDARAFYAELKRLESQTFTQLMALKKDLDTVAVNTDASLQDTARTIVQLADFKQAMPPK